MKTAGVDLRPFGLALVKLARAPQIAVWTLLAGIAVEFVISPLAGASSGGLLGGVTLGLGQLIGQLVLSFGFALAIVAADAAWRRDRAPLDETWNEASRKMGDILIAAVGFQFCVWIAGYIGGLLGGFVSLAATLLAVYFLIYTIPAAAIGGIPGGAAVQVSLDRAKQNPLPTLAVVVAYVLLTVEAPPLIAITIGSLLASSLGEVATIAISFIQVLVSGLCYAYVATVLAKIYADISFGRRYYF